MDQSFEDIYRDFPDDRTTVCVGGSGAERGISWLIVGEAPGEEELEHGKPFIGRAGQYLRENLAKKGVDMSAVRFENAVRHRPPFDEKKNGHTPSDADIDRDREYIYRVLDLIRRTHDRLPVITPLGNVALQSICDHRGIQKNACMTLKNVIPDPHKEKWGHLDGLFTVIPTIHPSSILRGDSVTAGVWGSGKFAEHLNFAWLTAIDKVVPYWTDYLWVTDPNQFTEWADRVVALQRSGQMDMVSFDFETTGLSPYRPDARVVCFAMCAEEGKAIVVPYYHAQCSWSNDSIIQSKIRDDLRRVFEAVQICMWNGGFDLKWSLLKLQLDIPTFAFDGMLARHWVTAGLGLSLKLDDVVQENYGFFGHGIGLDKSNLYNAPVDILTRYAGGDADGTMRESRKVRAGMKSASMDLYGAFMRSQMRGVRTVTRMEMSGVKVNLQTNRQLNETYPQEMEPLVQKIEQSKWGRKVVKSLAERPRPLSFNLGSTVTLQSLLFDEMRLPLYKDPDAKGERVKSAKKEALEQFEEHCLAKIASAEEGSQAKADWEARLDIIRTLREWRSLKDEYTRYVKPIADELDPDGYLHPDFNMAGTVTGRFSSSFHGFPKKSKVKWQFVSRWSPGSDQSPQMGGVILAADMSQAEMRVLASLSEDENLIDTIKSGLDLHTANASKMFGVEPDKVSKTHRDLAKRCGFGVVYGIGAETLSKRIGCSEEEAAGHIERWYRIYPKTKLWVARIYEIAKQKGRVSTPFGRFRWIDNIKKSRWGDRAWIQSYNTLIQSSASDLTYHALLESDSDFLGHGLNSLIFGFIHDSIVTDVYPGEMWTVASILKHRMEDWTNTHYGWIKAPMQADFEVGTSWGFPCSLSWEGTTMTANGSLFHAAALSRALQHMDGLKILREDQTGEDETRIEFSVAGMQNPFLGQIAGAA